METIKTASKSISKQSTPIIANYDWRNLVGLQSVMSELSLLLQCGRMHPVVLLEGREGLGKRHLAYWMAAKLLCAKASQGDNMPCGVCVDCSEVLAGSHRDLMIIDAGEETIKTTDVESLQNHLDMLSPSGRRIGLILNSDRMTREAANRALKTLEEPTNQARIILTSSRPLLMPSTVLGRCLRWKVKPLNREDVLNWLANKLKSQSSSVASKVQLESFAMRWGYSPGQLLKKIETFDQVGLSLEQDVDILLSCKAPIEVLQSASDISKIHKVKIPELLRTVEWSISASLRGQLLGHSSHEFKERGDVQNSARIRRRTLLREVRSKAVFGKIALNTQLVAESIGLCRWNEGDSK